MARWGVRALSMPISLLLCVILADLGRPVGRSSDQHKLAGAPRPVAPPAGGG